MKVIRNAAWLWGARGLADVSSFVLFTVISRSFGSAGTGQYSYAFAIGNLVALIGSSGLEEYGIRELASAAAEARPRLWRAIASTQLVQLIPAAIFLAVFMMSGLNTTASPVLMIEAAVFFVGWYVARTLFIPAMALQSMSLPALLDLSCRLVAILTAIGLVVWSRAPLAWALLGFPIAGVAMMGMAFGNSLRHAGRMRIDTNPKELRATFRETIPFAATEVLNQFYARADIILIAAWLGASAVGIYAIGVKFVEVGLLPMVLLGTAAYPVVSALASSRQPALAPATRDIAFLMSLLSGWLAVTIATLLPVLIVPLFGAQFRPVIALLPWFALFALLKGGEVALYRLLFCFRRQSWYAASLGGGTVLIILFNLILIPRYELRGAIAAAIISTLFVDLACLYGLRGHMRVWVFGSAGSRVVAALLLTGMVYLSTEDIGVNAVARAVLCFAFYPVAGVLVGLLPDWRHGALFSLKRKERRPDVPLAIGGQDAAAQHDWWHPELLEFTNDAIIIWEMEGEGILYWNRGAEHLYGYSRDEARGKVTHSLLRTRVAGGGAGAEIESTLARYGVWVGEIRHTTREGKEVVVEGRLALMPQQNGRWLVLEVNRDVTDQKEAEAVRAALSQTLMSMRLPST